MSGDRFEQLRRIVPDVSRETFEALIRFEGIFRKWASVINLAAPSTLDDLWTRHIVDSAQLLGLRPDAVRWLDLGSGGGFPGIVTAILLKGRGKGHVDLVESAGKKAAFLRTVAAEMSLPVAVHSRRIETFTVSDLALPEVLTARALAPLPVLLGLASTWLCAGSIGLFQKGRDYPREVAQSRDEWSFDLIEHPSATETGASILEISALRPLGKCGPAASASR